MKIYALEYNTDELSDIGKMYVSLDKAKAELAHMFKYEQDWYADAPDYSLEMSADGLSFQVYQRGNWVSTDVIKEMEVLE